MTRRFRPVLLLYAVAIAAMIAATWWSTRLPPIVDDLPGKKFAEVASGFQRRLNEHYPIGSPAATLDHDLRAAGFTVAGTTATFSSRFLICARTWTTTWQARGDEIAGIAAGYREGCL